MYRICLIPKGRERFHVLYVFYPRRFSDNAEPSAIQNAHGTVISLSVSFGIHGARGPCIDEERYAQAGTFGVYIGTDARGTPRVCTILET